MRPGLRATDCPYNQKASARSPISSPNAQRSLGTQAHPGIRGKTGGLRANLTALIHLLAARSPALKGEVMDTAGIQFYADALDDIEATRVANENRVRSLIKEGDLPANHPEVIWMQELVDSLLGIERKVVLQLSRTVRQHSLGLWLKTQKGVGDKQAGRLLGAIGDPYWHPDEERPRTVSELRQFCGHGDPERSHRSKGMSKEELLGVGSPDAKKRVHLIAEKMLQCGNRETYDKRRAITCDKVHEKYCVRCGPSGKPAQPGTPWSDGHKHADALRVVGKQFLKELWREAKRLHEEE